MEKYNLDKFMAELERRNAAQPEFIQAAKEVIETIIDLVNDTPAYLKARILDRITEPDRTISFKVEWEDDNHVVQVNKGYRVQFNNAIGPYKGGLRFHPSVTLGTLKFLGFEQMFKNSLTTLPMGGGKGGSDFNPKGKSDAEINRFCKAFMAEMGKYIGPEIDVPAGDIGVGGRELGFLYGQWKRMTSEHNGVLTGKGINWGGSLVRPEATGFGTVYYADEMLKAQKDSMKGKRVALSGFGNVTWGAAIKATELGAKVVTISGPDGYILDENGVGTKEKWDFMLELRSSNNDVVAPYAKKFGAKFFPKEKPWGVKCDLAFPCAIQNELNGDDAKKLIANGAKYIIETSNMGCTPEAVAAFHHAKVLFGPGKAANAGGVATSGIEMMQNSMKDAWTAETVDRRLKDIMISIHEAGMKYGKEKDGYINYVKGSNIAGFKKIADAMLDMGF